MIEAIDSLSVEKLKMICDCIFWSCFVLALGIGGVRIK
jgi:hypothetical protein